VYARFANGKVDRLRTLAAACPVETRTPIQNLDGISADDSVRWLTSLSNRDDLDHDVPSSLAAHQGVRALEALKNLARNDARAETRQHALFWLAQRGSPDAEAVIQAALKNDADGGVREHAVFALSMLPDGRATKALIAAAEDRSLSREHRKRALFWLAQSESEGAQQYLDKVLLGAAR
jgi:HEAT repeat protein